MEDYLVIRPWAIFERGERKKIFFGAEDGMWVWEESVGVYPEERVLRKLRDLEQAWDEFYDLEREGWTLTADGRRSYDEC